MYRVRILDSAIRELSRLDISISRRIMDRVHWLAANIDKIKPEALARELKGLYKLRVGDYRVVYEVLHEEQTIVIHAIGHHREIYRKR